MKISFFVGLLHYMARTTSSSLPRTSSTTQGTNHNVRIDGRRYVDYNSSNKLLRHLTLSFSFEFCEYITNKSLAFFSLPSLVNFALSCSCLFSRHCNLVWSRVNGVRRRTIVSLHSVLLVATSGLICIYLVDLQSILRIAGSTCWTLR